jgi:hypothetical protein
MIVTNKSIMWRVSIPKGDLFYTQHSLDNVSYARIDGDWRHNTGGSVFEWRSCHSDICKCGCGNSKGELLEIGFQKTQRNRKLEELLNE